MTAAFNVRLTGRTVCLAWTRGTVGVQGATPTWLKGSTKGDQSNSVAFWCPSNAQKFFARECANDHEEQNQVLRIQCSANYAC